MMLNIVSLAAHLPTMQAIWGDDKRVKDSTNVLSYLTYQCMDIMSITRDKADHEREFGEALQKQHKSG